MSQDERRLVAVTAGGALALLVMLFIIWPAPVSVLFLGVITGSLSALTAMGLVLVYRANKIVNFAQASLGAIAAVLAASLIAGPGWSFWVASAAGLLAALALGGLVEVAFIRRFARAPRLVLTVATIGVAQLCDAGALFVPKLFDLDEIPQPTPIDWTFTWDPLVLNGGHLLVVIVVPIVAAGLALFFRRSRFGVAMRASAESADRAALLGIPVKRVNTLVWVMAAGLGGIGTILRLPIQGVAIGSVGGANVLLIALAAAVVARMERLWVAFAMSLALGMIEQAVQFETGQTYASKAVVLAVILGALLLQRGGVERARLTGASAWAGQREVRPIPRELRRLPEIRVGVPALATLAGLLLVLLPLQWNASRVNLFTGGVIVAIIFLSLLMITGFAGQISLGQLAVVSISGAVAGSMSQNGNELFTTILVGGLVGAGVSVLLGVPALRMSGPFFAVTSLAFAVATGTFFLNPEYFRWLRPEENVRILRPVIFDKFDLESDWSFYYFVLVFFVLAVAVAARVRTSRTGRAIVATRDNTRAAQAYGISARNAQLTAFGLGGLLAGIAGALNVYYLHGLSVSYLSAETGILLFAIAIVGGLGSVPGALIGAAYLTFLENSPFTASPLSQLFTSGVGVLLILMILPGGLGGLVYDARDAVLRAIARRHGVVVPSLLADLRVDEDGNPVEAAPRPGALDRLRAELRRPGRWLADQRALRSRRHQVVATHADGEGPLLTVRGLELSYGKTQVLFGVDCHVDRHEIVALLGTNGAGKSTLLSAIAGLNRPSRGSIVLDGHDITGQRPTETVAEGVVFMPGGKGVFPTLTVRENLQLAGWLFKDDPEHVAAVTEQVLDFFPVLRERLDQRAGNLSGGEQQMLTLGQAFILKPKLLMIDELSLGLAPIIVEQLLGIVRSIHAAGTTVVLVEQSVNVAISLAERAIFLEKGEVRFDGPTADLLDRPDVLRAVFLEGTAKRPADDVRPATRVRPAFEAACGHCGHEHPVALDVAELSVSFGGVQAVQDVSFDVRQGQIVGIIGPNGAGKTTVLDLISGFVTPTSGRVEIDGTDVTALPPDARAALGLGRSFQDARLFSAMTVRQTIATALERHVLVRDPIAPLVLSPAVAASERAVAEQVDALIDLMNLGAYADKFVGELSTGTRRVVDLACTLAHRPSVLLLDEPSSGIAQRETEALGPLLLDIRDKTGAALVVIEHDMPLICGVSDELIALELGSVIARGQPSDVVNDPRVVAGYLGGTEEVVFRSGTTRRRSRSKTAPATSATRSRRTPLKAAR